MKKITIILIFLILYNCSYKYFSKANQYEIKGKYAEAAKYYYKIIKKDASNLKAYLGLADALYGVSVKKSGLDIFSLSDWKNAISALEIAVNIDDKNKEKRIKYLGNSYKILSTIYLQNNKFDSSLFYNNKAGEILKEDIEIFFQKAYLYEKQKKYEIAIEKYLKCLKINKNYQAANMNLAILYNKLNKFDKAKELLKKFIVNEKVPYKFSFIYIDSCLKQKKLKEAKKIIDKIDKKKIKDNVILSDYYNKLGVYYYSNGNKEKAKENFTNAIKENFWNLKVRINLGNLYFENNNFQNAESEYISALELYKSEPLIYNYIGLCKYKLGKYEEAKNLFLKAINLDSNYVSAYLHLSNLYSEIFNDYNKSQFYYKVYKIKLKANTKK